MNLLVLGKGKMGTLVIELAEQRGHKVHAHDEFDNIKACMLTPDRLIEVDVIVDFTTPGAVLENVEAVARARRNLVVGTTGWYGELPRVRQIVQEAGIGFVYGANFSIGVNLFYDMVRAAAPALKQGYHGHILERHHIHKKDAPSGTAVKIQQAIAEAIGTKLDINSEREGEVVGTHVVTLDSQNDTITLAHDAKSRRGFAEGALRAAEWIKGKHGFYDFKDIFREV